MFRKKKFFLIIFLDYIRNFLKHKLLTNPEFAKETPLGQKAKPGRKKKTTRALLFQTGDPELPSAEEDETES